MATTPAFTFVARGCQNYKIIVNGQEVGTVYHGTKGWTANVTAFDGETTTPCRARAASRDAATFTALDSAGLI